MVQAPEEEALSGGALPPDWEEANGPTGLYYYNTRTQETSWTRPEGGLTDEELAGSAADHITADAPPRARRSLNLRKACCTCLCVLGILLGLVVIGLVTIVQTDAFDAQHLIAGRRSTRISANASLCH